MKKKVQLPNLPKQTMIAIGLAVGGLLLGLIGYLAVISPENAKIVPIESQIATARASLISAEEAPAKIKPIPAKAADLFKLTNAMPDSDDVPGVLIDLTQLAKESSVELTGVTPTADVPETGYSEVPVSVLVTGSYAGMTKFLTEMRRAVVVNGDTLKVSGRLLEPTSIDLTTPDGKLVSATITLNAFSYGTGTPPATTTPGTTTTETTTTTATTG
jgi:Tfp pilus assembly protein PilO